MRASAVALGALPGADVRAVAAPLSLMTARFTMPLGGLKGRDRPRRPRFLRPCRHPRLRAPRRRRLRVRESCRDACSALKRSAWYMGKPGLVCERVARISWLPSCALGCDQREHPTVEAVGSDQPGHTLPVTGELVLSHRDVVMSMCASACVDPRLVAALHHFPADGGESQSVAPRCSSTSLRTDALALRAVHDGLERPDAHSATCLGPMALWGFSTCSGPVAIWTISHREHNRLMHAMHGNTTRKRSLPVEDESDSESPPDAVALRGRTSRVVTRAASQLATPPRAARVSFSDTPIVAEYPAVGSASHGTRHERLAALCDMKRSKADLDSTVRLFGKRRSLQLSTAQVVAPELVRALGDDLAARLLRSDVLTLSDLADTSLEDVADMAAECGWELRDDDAQRLARVGVVPEEAMPDHGVAGTDGGGSSDVDTIAADGDDGGPAPTPMTDGEIDEFLQELRAAGEAGAVL